MEQELHTRLVQPMLCPFSEGDSKLTNSGVYAARTASLLFWHVRPVVHYVVVCARSRQARCQNNDSTRRPQQWPSQHTHELPSLADGRKHAVNRQNRGALAAMQTTVPTYQHAACTGRHL